MFTLPGQTKVNRKRWTVMLYMVTSDKETGRSVERAEITERAAIRDIRELQRVGSTDDVNIVVQLDRRWPGYPERYLIKKNGSTPLGSVAGVRNNSSGNPNALKGFVDWARKEYPADHTMLVLWGHAYGLGFGRDHGDALTMPEIRKALDAKEGYAIDILGANACAMCYAEAAYELRNAATFLVAPEVTMPFAGWPYETILRRMTRSDMKPDALAEHIVTDYLDSFGRDNVALTLLDLTKAGDLRDLVKALAVALKSGINSTRTGKPVSEAFLDTAHGSVRPLIDLVDLCERLADVDSEAIAAAAAAMKVFLKSGPDKFVRQYEGDPDFEGLHGLGMFAPSVTGAADLTRLEITPEEYNKLALVNPRSNPWSEIVHKHLREALAPINQAVAEVVRNTGATAVEERTGVAQLLVSVYRSFVKLDEALVSAQKHVLSVVDGNGASKGLGATTGKSNGKSNGKTNGKMNGRNIAPNAEFGPPYLRLAPRYRQTQYAVVQATVDATDATTVVASETYDARLRQTVAPLAELEDALANVERTARRVMTNQRFGLGEDQVKAGLGEDQVKAGLGEDQVKAGLGEDQVKAGLGEDQVKAGLGILSLRIATDTGSRSASPIGTVTAMYRQVALALQLSEEAVAKIESLVQSLPMNGSGYQDGNTKQRWMDQVTRSFRELRDMVDNAKSTTVSVLLQPTYGLGPSPQTTQGTVSREQLAIAGGLSSRVLRLM